MNEYKCNTIAVIRAHSARLAEMTDDELVQLYGEWSQQTASAGWLIHSQSAIEGFCWWATVAPCDRMPASEAVDSAIESRQETTIQVTHDGSEHGDAQERCCKCRSPTRYWYGTGALNVALCQACSLIYKAKDIPTKSEWIESERTMRNKSLLY